MNIKKIIFIVFLSIISVLIIILVFSMNSKPNQVTNNNNDKTFKIWILSDSADKFKNFVNTFKTTNTSYQGLNVEVESFDNYEDYEQSFASALVLGEAPDLFVLNNNTSSFLEEQSVGISADVINPNDFRKKYKQIFGEELILSYKEDGSDETKEFLKGIPVGYEELGIYYNRRFVKPDELSTIASLNDTISNLKEKYPSKIPISLGNGTTVYGVEDIISQFFLLQSVDSIYEASGNELKQILGSYFIYGDEDGDNAYNSKYIELRQMGENNLNIFSKGEVLMIVGYPRLLDLIDSYGYSKSFLMATPFPYFSLNTGKILINYNYFAINKNTSKPNTAKAFLKYLYSDNGAENYFKEFSYYLPALVSLEDDYLGKKIHKDYNVTLGDFYDGNHELSSFDKGLRIVFDREIKSILDDPSNYINNFENLTETILCKKKKYIDLEDLSRSCN